MAQFHKNVGAKLNEFRPSRIVNSVSGADATNRKELFKSARLKLTGFYLVGLVIFSLVLTLSIRGFADHTFDIAGAGERGAVRQLLNNYFSVPPQTDFFNQYQSNQSANVHHDLDVYVAIVNVVAIVLGGIVSYWYAGRTLRPIEEAHETQARFAADASHELRTPLTSLKVENEVFLRQKGAKISEARELIKSNLEEVQRLENLASSLLALSRYEQASLSLKPTNLARAVDRAIEIANKSAETKKINFVKNIPPSTKVLADSDSITQLISIVLDNAIKYGPDEGDVYIDAIKSDGHDHLSIRDQGEGIDEIDIEHIFDRLYRGDKSRNRKIPGYGLGLSLAREIARANRATITARNYPEGGAQFVISLNTVKV